MPAFTYKTMVTPRVGPPNNGLTYGADEDLNKMAEPFEPDMPVDPMIGILAETLRRHPAAKRTLHPIQSFAGINVDSTLDSQTIDNPLAPIGSLLEQDGWVLLLGVDHTVSTSIHYAEKLAGRRQFVRWALLKDRIIECSGFPGDSSGFNQIADDLEGVVRRVEIGNAVVQAIPLKILVAAVVNRIKQDPLALLCQREDCERCNAMRNG
jgi:aminoglycoside 3-N-acetyltransferase